MPALDGCVHRSGFDSGPSLSTPVSEESEAQPTIDSTTRHETMRLHDFLDFRAREHPEADFIVQGRRRLSYRQAQVETHRLAQALIAAGLGIGDRVAIVAKNSIEYIFLYFAASRAGVVPAPLNYRLSRTEWAYMINDARARIVFAGKEYLPAIDEIRPQLDTVERFIALDGRAPDWESYEQWVADQPARPPERFFSDEADAFQLYTSGTTGRPKGAILTHRTVTACVLQMALALDVEPGARHLMIVPLYHIFGVGWTYLCAYWGGCLVIQADFDPEVVIHALSEEQIGYAPLVPAMIQACLVTVADAADRRYDRLRMIIYGGSPIAEATLRQAHETFQCAFTQIYGMTEAAPLSLLLPSDHRRAFGERPDLLLSAGRAVAGTEVRIVDADDRPLPHGVLGEVVARGPQLMRGYWNRPEASAEALRGGWMHTGDAGTVDEEGYLYIRDRVKDIIVSGGEKISSRAVEEVLFQHPAIADAAVIGVPDPQWGETVKAIVVLKEGATATEAEIIDFCRGKLGGFERPRSVEFVRDLPRNPSGKVLKRVLREPYWAGHERRVGGA